jgi:hypothetical protein
VTNYLRQVLLEWDASRRAAAVVTFTEMVNGDPEESLPLTSLVWAALQELVDLDVAERGVLEQMRKLDGTP